MDPYHPLHALCTVDGRDYLKTRKLRAHFSEYAFLRALVFVEVEYFLFLNEEGIIRPLSAEEKILLRGMVSGFTLADAETISHIEHGGHHIPATNHDVKAVEYFIRLKIETTTLADLVPMIHFCLTSEDVKNLALNVLLRGFRKREYLPVVDALLDQLAALSTTHADTPMKARTHGQPASPTTIGKEFAVFLDRLRKQRSAFHRAQLNGKLNGATGNFNAHHFVLPHHPWLEFSERFVARLGFSCSSLTTQVEPADSLIAFLHYPTQINLILFDLCQDLWRYFSDGYFSLIPAQYEVGSSTMPHKVNPIGLEHAEGALKKSNALLSCFDTLAISRLQRDLSDSTVKRDIGLALAYSYEAVVSITNALRSIMVNKEKITRDLDEEYAVLAEAAQIFLRKKGIAQGYELLKQHSRGKNLSAQDYRALVRSLPIASADRCTLEMLRPEIYIGIAPLLARKAALDWKTDKEKGDEAI